MTAARAGRGGLAADLAGPGTTRGGTAAADALERRVTLSALWVSLLFVFAYVDLFGLYRADVRADIARGVIAGFDIGPGFLLGATLYILPASLMVCLSLLLSPRTAALAHRCLAALYAATVVASAVGEWSYYLLASGVELALLVTILRLAGARRPATPAASPP